MTGYNKALGKAAVLSTNNYPGVREKELLTDGDTSKTDPVICIHTDVSEDYPWAKIDLGEPFIIRLVTITAYSQYSELYL